MAVRVFYTNVKKERYIDLAGVIPSDLVTVSAGRCAARVTLEAMPDGSGAVYAEIPSAMEGRVTSFALRLVSGTPSGILLLTTVSPLVDAVGSYLYAFCEDIMPALVGPPMYRRTNMRGTYYCTDKMNPTQKIYAIIVGAPGLEGVEADVALVVDTH